MGCEIGRKKMENKKSAFGTLHMSSFVIYESNDFRYETKSSRIFHMCIVRTIVAAWLVLLSFGSFFKIQMSVYFSWFVMCRYGRVEEQHILLLDFYLFISTLTNLYCLFNTLFLLVVGVCCCCSEPMKYFAFLSRSNELRLVFASTDEFNTLSVFFDFPIYEQSRVYSMFFVHSTLHLSV